MFHPQQPNIKHLAAIAVILLGWVLELALTYIVAPSSPITLASYLLFYIHSINLRVSFLIFGICLIYYVKGSVPIVILMGFNLAVIALNIFCLTPSNFEILDFYRQNYFAPGYRIVELILLSWTVWHARNTLFNYGLCFYHWLYFMANRRRIQRKEL